MESKGGKDEDDNLESLEKEFQEVLNELVGDKSLVKFRLEYEKLINALKKSHESEKRLMAKCRGLNEELVSNSAKVTTAMKMSQEDQATITSLKREIEKAWKMFDSIHEKESKAQETILTLRKEITNLTGLVEEGAGLSSGEDHDKLLKSMDELTQERDELRMTVMTLKEEEAKNNTTLQEMESEKESVLKSLSQIQQQLQVRQNEMSREIRQKEKVEKEVKQLRSDMEAKMADIKALTLQTQQDKEERQTLEKHQKDLKNQIEVATKELEQMHSRNIKLQKETEQHSQTIEKLSQENQQKASILKIKEEELSQMRQENAKLTKMRETIHKKCHQLEDEKVEVEVHRETLKTQKAGLEREIEASQKQAEVDKKAIEELVRERDILNKNMIKAADATEKQQNIVKLQEQVKKNLDQEIRNYRDEAQKQRKIIYQLEKDRDRYINEVSDLTYKVLQHMDSIKLKDTEIYEYKKKVAEVESKYKQQQNLYEADKCIKNANMKSLIEAQDEIGDMKGKLKHMNRQFEQLKEEISGKEAALAKEHLELQRVDKEKEALKAEIQIMKQHADETKQYIKSQEAEQQKLLKIIANADAEQIQQKKQLDQVISERHILGTQLQHRNIERALLYEKIKIQQSILNKGNVEYKQRLADIHLHKLEIKRLRGKKVILDKTVSNVQDLKREVFFMQRELNKERKRCRNLEEQMENPMNVHRWRKLEASDPSKYELIQKIHSFQRRLISKTQEVVEKELLLQEKDKLYVELKHTLARQPGPEAVEQLHQFHQALRVKTRKLMALTAEVNMWQSKNQEYKEENQRLNDILQDVKMKSLLQKRKEQQDKDKSKARVEQPMVLPQINNRPRFTGGGFSFNGQST